MGRLAGEVDDQGTTKKVLQFSLLDEMVSSVSRSLEGIELLDHWQACRSGSLGVCGSEAR